MAAKRGRAITSFGQAFPSLSGGEATARVIDVIVSDEAAYEIAVADTVARKIAATDAAVYEVALSDASKS